MKSNSSLSHLTFHSPAVYRIRVRGQVAPRWADRLEGMSIQPVSSESEPVVTVLEGELLDQAALAGVLNTLYGMHLPVLSVECVDASQTEPPL